MPDRADLAAALLAILGFSAGALLIAFVPGAMNGDNPSPPVYFIVTLPIFSYAAYWAFSIRHALAVPLYRRQAFGIGFITLAFWSSLVIWIVVPNTAPLVLSLGLTNFFFYFLFVVIFYWIDASILASRRSDPLLRDTLYWSKIRIPLWFANVVIWGIPLAVIAYGVVAGDNDLLGEMNSGNFPNTPIYQAFTVIYNLPILVLICGIIYIPAIAIRAKWDRSLRRHFTWLVPTVVVLLLLFFGNLGPGSLAGHLFTALLVVIAGYSLYRSAKALVPLNKVSLSD